MKNILCAIDKCLNLLSNYPKGNSTEFKNWCITYHPDYPLYPVERTTSARNKMVLKLAVAAYTNAWLYKLFLDKALSTLDADNILQELLFTILSSVNTIALSRLMSIFHFSANVPMWWFSGKHTHTLSAHDWSVKSMGRAIDCLYNSMLKLDKDGWKILDEQFMFNIFNPLKIKPFDEYVKYIFDFF